MHNELTEIENAVFHADCLIIHENMSIISRIHDTYGSLGRRHRESYPEILLVGNKYQDADWNPWDACRGVKLVDLELRIDSDPKVRRCPQL